MLDVHTNTKRHTQPVNKLMTRLTANLMNMHIKHMHSTWK